MDSESALTKNGWPRRGPNHESLTGTIVWKLALAIPDAQRRAFMDAFGEELLKTE